MRERRRRRLQYIGLALLALATVVVVFFALAYSPDVPQLWEMTDRILPPKDK